MGRAFGVYLVAVVHPCHCLGRLDHGNGYADVFCCLLQESRYSWYDSMKPDCFDVRTTEMIVFVEWDFFDERRMMKGKCDVFVVAAMAVIV